MDLDAEFRRIRDLRTKLEPIVDDLVAMVANYKSYESSKPTSSYDPPHDPPTGPSLGIDGQSEQPEQPVS